MSEATTRPAVNEHLALRLEEVADLLEAQHDNPFRVRAYRDAASTLRRLERPVPEIVAAEGLAGLTSFPGIGDGLARTIDELARTDRLALLERLRGEAGTEEVFDTVPGIGPELARRIREELGIASLYELELAAVDGSLARVEGMGENRVRAVRESLAGRFRRDRRGAESLRALAPEPPVSELLDVDAEYRRKAEAGELPKIAPRRLNPTGEAWLPILHTARGERHYTALFSNTPLAHELGRTRDWVVIYREDDGGQGQWTVITCRTGRLAGQRVVRGRKQESAEPQAG